MSLPVIVRALKIANLDGELQHVRTLTSAVTTAWGVDWDEDYIARDLMQNFFDANRDRLSEVVVRDIDTHVVVSAPTRFELEHLFYLGSEKGDDDVGQYGEGFKVAATCLLRDHAVTPIAISGRDVAVLRISEQTVADTKMCPIEYDFYHSSREIPGTALVLPGCSPKLTESICHGLSHFFHERNPLLGERLWSSNKNEFEIYSSTNDRGHIFYRMLKRGEMEDIPLVLVIHKKYQQIEQKISKDRDRNAFGEEIMELFYSLFARYGFGKYQRDAIKVVLRAAEPCWEKGHPLLRKGAENIHPSWDEGFTKDLFHGRYYARSSHDRDPAVQAEIERLERSWQKENRICLPGYFGRFGVANAVDELRRIRAKALEESKKNNQRAPTTAEYEAIRLLGGILNELAPEVMAVFNRGRTSYTVAKTETLLGELKSSRTYHSRDVFLAESVFVDDFPKAVATFLHEHSHIFGQDGSRGFSDALTQLLETVIRERLGLDPLEQEWEELRKSVQRERTNAAKNVDGDGLHSWISGMSEDELRTLLHRIPTSVLKRLKKKAGDGDSE